MPFGQAGQMKRLAGTSKCSASLRACALLMPRLPLSTSETTLLDPNTEIKSRCRTPRSSIKTRSGSTGSAWPSGYFVSLNWRTKVKLAYQSRDEFSEALFLWRERLASCVEPLEFRNHAFVLRFGLDHTGNARARSLPYTAPLIAICSRFHCRTPRPGGNGTEGSQLQPLNWSIAP